VWRKKERKKGRKKGEKNYRATDSPERKKRKENNE